MVEKPAPPVPADADLTHYGEMPLEVRRLRDSGIAGEPNAEVFRCAVLLWCVAWHQLPAGSLPLDDAELCRLVGLGRDLKTWRRVRAGALRGWRGFADGRLYHPVVTEKVIKGVNSARLSTWSRECDRIRKENKARGERGEIHLPIPGRPAIIPYEWPEEIRKPSGGNGDGLPPEVGQIPPENGLKGREGKEREGKKESDSPLAAASPTAARESPIEKPKAAAAANGGPRAAMADRDLVDEAFKRWSALAQELKISDAGFLNSDRRAALTQRLTEIGGLEGWDLFLGKTREAKFLLNPDGLPKFWVGLGKLLEPEHFSKILEDRYAEHHERARDDGERSVAAGLAGVHAAGSR